MKKRIYEINPGIGCFREGLSRLNSGWETVGYRFATTTQRHERECYEKNFKDNDAIIKKEKDAKRADGPIPWPNHELLFSNLLLEYSSIFTAFFGPSKQQISRSEWMWMLTHRLIEEKKPLFCVFELSPILHKESKDFYQQSFSLLLNWFSDLDYSVEWRQIEVSNYNLPLCEKRLFVFAYRNSTVIAQEMQEEDPLSIIEKAGVLAKAFPASIADFSEGFLPPRMCATVTLTLNYEMAGYMHCGKYALGSTIIEGGEKSPIKNYMLNHIIGHISNDHLNNHESHIVRVASPDEPLPVWHKCAHPFVYIKDPLSGEQRVLTPEEFEIIKGYKKGWTEGLSFAQRCSLLCNANSTQVITMLGKEVDSVFWLEDKRDIQNECEWPKALIDDFMSRAEYEIYKKAGLKPMTIGGKIALVKEDIDLDGITDQFNRTNRERMANGVPPLDRDGIPIELHHIGQRQDSSLAELDQNEHRGKGNYNLLHDTKKDSEIDRNMFSKEKKKHWMARISEVNKSNGEKENE